jgi:hypothetical protein
MKHNICATTPWLRCTSVSASVDVLACLHIEFIIQWRLCIFLGGRNEFLLQADHGGFIQRWQAGMAYSLTPMTISVCFLTAREQEISTEPPPNNVVVLDEVSDNNHGIIEQLLCFINSHFVSSSSHQDSDCLLIGIVLQDQNTVLPSGIVGTQGDVFDPSGPTHFMIRHQFLHASNNAPPIAMARCSTSTPLTKQTNGSFGKLICLRSFCSIGIGIIASISMTCRNFVSCHLGHSLVFS